jgi:long-chain acyl-CoA synthetase
VAVIGSNCHRYLELYLAVPASGLVLVPLNARHALGELSYALRDAEVSVLFTDRHVEELADVVPRLITLPDGYEALLDDAPSDDWPGDVDEQTLAGLFYTGGTTGAAKGVMLTHGNLVANAFHLATCWPPTRSTRWLIVAPMFHAAGTIATLATVWAGGRHVIAPQFDAADVLDTIEREQVTATLFVPAMMAALASEQGKSPRDVSSLTLLGYGSAPTPVDLLRKTHSAFPAADLFHIYGATETAPIVTLFPGTQHVLDTPRAASCGQAAIGVEVEIVDLDGQPRRPGEVGEVRVRGANVTTGYWRKPRETSAALGDGWYSTGDVGLLDDDGYLFIVDRIKDMIITGGENVYSIEVEQALLAHPAVAEVAVFGIPDERWGEAVHAVAVLRQDVTTDELVRHCRSLIAPYKVPKGIELTREPLPRSAAGKVLKRELRARYVTVQPPPEAAPSTHAPPRAASTEPL